MQEQTSIAILRRAREQIESAIDDDHPLNTLTQTIGRTLDHQIRWMSDLKNIADEDEEEDFTLNESLRSIRRHFDELRRDKEQLTAELVRLEQTLRAEQDQAVTEKEYEERRIRRIHILDLVIAGLRGKNDSTTNAIDFVNTILNCKVNSTIDHVRSPIDSKL